MGMDQLCNSIFCCTKTQNPEGVAQQSTSAAIRKKKYIDLDNVH